ncbi:hypothetical protein JHD50_06570 [Sulfurimonas sp. MAG313]|nr:hypothetical protein [Sulfurimonas sp. MAG313]MDF1880969.1 hypothetical protein [Sulfurimonas sp. MAG313]
MKQLNKTDLSSFMERFSNLTNGEIVSLEFLTPTSFKIVLTVQDKNRGFDWVNLNFEFTGILDAKLLDDAALKAVDMENGVSISFTQEGVEVGFGSGEYLSSPLRIYTEVLKYEETSFAL